SRLSARSGAIRVRNLDRPEEMISRPKSRFGMDSGGVVRGGCRKPSTAAARRLPPALTITDRTGEASGNYTDVMGEEPAGVDLSGVHNAIDRLKVQLCRCQNQGTCIACRGFEVVRQQVQVV